jgi:CRISPR-associated endonuclease/helicase Cas3
MNGKPLAHSAQPERGIPAQPFWKHIERVTRAALENARHAARYWAGDREFFCGEVEAAARLHDCGKLAPENQEVLASSCKKGLPVKHEDGGIALLLEKGRDTAALLVHSHHRGLPSIPEEEVRALQKGAGARYRIREAVEHTGRHLQDFAACYAEAGFVLAERAQGALSALAQRIALSCLVDADHTDTARHYREAVPEEPARVRWEERIQALDRYVAGLPESARSQNRQGVYACCRDASIENGIVACDAAVGTGKTTAVMAHLLCVAARKELRHIFVVLPYTNIIQQSVEVYRKALVLDGESPGSVVAEVHHRAEFKEPDLREMSVLWDAPVTVTTAVQFFETLAGNMPARLRKLHELAGSAVFLDEAHAAIPIWLWPQTWLWLKELASDWGCYFTLASGSLARFWENEQIISPTEQIPDLISPEIRAQLAQAESHRMEIQKHGGQLNCEGVRAFIAEKPGPRLAILNTVQSAAVLAKAMKKAGADVLHLSTALTPKDRERIVKRVRARLKDENDPDWALIATSCVEAGVDFSFRTAIRESCSLASIVQTGGRVNRHGRWEGAQVWDVRLQDPLFNEHPAFRSSRQVLANMLDAGIAHYGSDSVTEALRQELVLKDVSLKADQLRKCEAVRDFPEVAQLYQVIDSETYTVVIEDKLVERLKAGQKVRWQELLMGSVQIWGNKIEEWKIELIPGHKELYYWNNRYDADLLGYMEGILPLIEGRQTGLHIV